MVRAWYARCMEKWRFIQKKGFSNVAKLMDFLELDVENRAKVIQRKDFPLLIPFRLAEKMPKNCLDNPLALQFIPTIQELDETGEVDPVGDEASAKSKALLHKYEGRALLLTTGACTVHCRYCFRQNYGYKSELDKALRIIAKDTSIKEVILSGGDPLSLSDRALQELFDQLEQVDQVEIIRFHTRFPVGVPERINERFLELLEKCSKQVVFIIHINCIEEWDDNLYAHLYKIQRLGIPVLTQTVLLKNVNNSKEALYKLFWKLATYGIIPYYLHAFDRVKRALHFEAPQAEGARLINELRKCLPGYAVPQFVQEIKGQPFKVLIKL